MLKSCWVIAAAFGLFFLTVPKEGQGQQQNSGAYDEFYNLGFPSFDVGNQTDERRKIDQPCREGENNRSSDLCAQWKAADAAEISADYNRLMFIVGVLTVLAAAAAAVYASMAGKSAQEAVAVSKRFGKVQVRPFIVIDTPSIAKFEVGEIPQFFVSLENYGVHPALRVSLKIKINRYKADGFNIFFGNEPWAIGEVIGKNPKNLSISCNDPITKEVMDRTLNQDIDFVIAVLVKYFDIFGRRYFATTKVYLRYDPVKNMLFFYPARGFKKRI